MLKKLPFWVNILIIQFYLKAHVRRPFKIVKKGCLLSKFCNINIFSFIYQKVHELVIIKDLYSRSRRLTGHNSIFKMSTTIKSTSSTLVGLVTSTVLSTQGSCIITYYVYLFVLKVVRGKQNDSGENWVPWWI